jgi:hypothetical protein
MIFSENMIQLPNTKRYYQILKITIAARIPKNSITIRSPQY